MSLENASKLLLPVRLVEFYSPSGSADYASTLVLLLDHTEFRINERRNVANEGEDFANAVV